MKLGFVTFSGGKYIWNLAARRLVAQAKLSQKFEAIKHFKGNKYICFSERDSDFILNNQIGYGNWIWKPIIIKNFLIQFPEVTHVWYADAGCDIQFAEKTNRHFNYLLFSLDEKNALFFNSPFKERDFTNSHTLDFFQQKYGYRVKNNEEQIVATSFILERDFGEKFCDDWYSLMRINNYSFLRSLSSNTQSAHRFDQSILSLLLKSRYDNENKRHYQTLSEDLLNPYDTEDFLRNEKFLIFSRNRSPIPFSILSTLNIR
jgi:hypothetical protein